MVAGELPFLQGGDEKVVHATGPHPVGTEHSDAAGRRAAPQRHVGGIDRLDRVRGGCRQAQVGELAEGALGRGACSQLERAVGAWQLSLVVQHRQLRDPSHLVGASLQKRRSICGGAELVDLAQVRSLLHALAPGLHGRVGRS